MPISVRVYGKPGCHLCDVAESKLRELAVELDLAIEVLSIEGNPELESLYGEEIPVVLVEGKKLFKYRVEEPKLRRRVHSLAKLSPVRDAVGGLSPSGKETGEE